MLRDREDPNRYAIVVLFDSLDDAMTNNDLPAMGELAASMNDLTTAPTMFRNLRTAAADRKLVRRLRSMSMAKGSLHGFGDSRDAPRSARGC